MHMKEYYRSLNFRRMWLTLDEITTLKDLEKYKTEEKKWNNMKHA